MTGSMMLTAFYVVFGVVVAAILVESVRMAIRWNAPARPRKPDPTARKSPQTSPGGGAIGSTDSSSSLVMASTGSDSTDTGSGDSSSDSASESGGSDFSGGGGESGGGGSTGGWS